MAKCSKNYLAGSLRYSHTLLFFFAGKRPRGLWRWLCQIKKRKPEVFWWRCFSEGQTAPVHYTWSVVERRAVSVLATCGGELHTHWLRLKQLFPSVLSAYSWEPRQSTTTHWLCVLDWESVKQKQWLAQVHGTDWAPSSTPPQPVMKPWRGTCLLNAAATTQLHLACLEGETQVRPHPMNKCAFHLYYGL